MPEEVKEGWTSEMHRFKGVVTDLTTGVEIHFPTPTDIWLNIEGATWWFLNRATRRVKEVMGSRLDRSNVKIVLIIADNEE